MKYKNLLSAASLLALFSFSGFNKPTELITIYGDLDKDLVEEKIVVNELEKSNDSGKIRTIAIYKKNGEYWEEWIAESRSAVMGSTAGGQMGDPFRTKEISVNNGVLIINQQGGSSWRWSVTHKYRYQNGAMQLIGYMTNYGKTCENIVDFDYNILSGKAVYKKTFQKCGLDGEPTIIKTNKENFVKKLKITPNLQTINTKELVITIPKFKEKIIF